METTNTIQEDGPKQLTEAEILAFDYMPSSKLTKQVKGHENHIKRLKEKRLVHLSQNETDSNIERIRCDIRIEDHKTEMSKVNQILAYRLIH